MDGYFIIIEVDEFQHKSYDKDAETARNNFIWEGLGKKPIVIIRFNPDGYISSNGKQRSSPWKKDKNGNTLIKEDRYDIWKDRMNVLTNTIKVWLDKIPNENIIVKKLYYDKITI
jgi:hypothetical protein